VEGATPDLMRRPRSRAEKPSGTGKKLRLRLT
jgi:hypothetical protein